jgi:tetratricopeptide (TPR) repeat protein
MLKKILIPILVFHFNAEAQSSALAVGDSLYVNGNYTKAITAYKTHPNQAAVYDKIAKAYIAIGNFDLALENYKSSAEANPDDALVRFDYAKLLSRTKKYKEAAKLFEELIYVDYKNPNYHYESGMALDELNDSTAMNRFMSAYDLDQTHQKAIYQIALHHLKKRNNITSHKFIDKGLESYPNNAALVSLKAQNYYHQEYYDKAIVWFKKLLELNEKSEFIYEKLSLSYAQNSDYENAIKYRKLALASNPFDSSAMYVIGTYYEKLNDFENAAEYITKSLNLQDVPLNAEYRKLGTILNRQKKYDEALVAFQKALKEDPTDTFTKFYIIRTKDEYYADREAVVKLYEDFIEKNKETPFAKFAEMRLKELKEENFNKQD